MIFTCHNQTINF